MLIKLKCISEVCEYCIEVSEKELLDNPQYYKRCLVCNSVLEITKESLKGIVNNDLYKRAEEYINKWVKEIGWDETLSLIQRNKDQSCYRIYKEILLKKGFKLN